MKIPGLSTSRTAIAVIASTAINTKSKDNNAIVQYINDNDESIRCIEAMGIFLNTVKESRSKASVLGACASLYSALSGRSVVGSCTRLIDLAVEEFEDYFGLLQSGSDWVDVCDGLYGNINRIKNSILGNKIVKVFNHILAHSMYAKMGIEVDEKLFKAFEEKRLRPTVWQCATFADAIVSLLLFIAKAGRQALLTGNVEAFFVDDVVITKWLDEASAIRKNAEFISNPSAIGLTLANYISNLDRCVVTGQQLVKIFKTGQQHNIINSVLLELKLVKDRYTLSLAASCFRRAPIGVFLYGSAGVAKSFIASGLFHHYCSVRGIAKENAACWVRDDNDPFYSGYKSHFAGVLFDDAVKFRSNKVQGIDPSVKDIISAINNIPFITNQGELCDKGKIPFLSEWVGVTSNTHDLAADQYYNCSAAFLRRLQIRIEPVVKEPYRMPGEMRIDTRTIPADVQYPDLWTFKLSKPVLMDKDKGQFIQFMECPDYASLLLYMTELYTAHIESQDKLMKTVGAIGPEKLCECKLPTSICRCEGSPTEANNTILIGDVEIQTQSGITLPDRSREQRSEMAEWVTKYVGVRRKLEKKWCKDASHKMYYRQIWQEPTVTIFMDPATPRTDALLCELEKDVDNLMSHFDSCTPRARLDLLTDEAFGEAQEEDDDDYLDFEPELGAKCFFLEGHLKSIRDTVIKYVAVKLDDAEMALLDDYIYTKAPTYIARGWPMRNIVKGAQCYLSYYKHKVVDPNKFHAREFLLSDKENRLTRRALVWCAQVYFERPWVYATCNFVGKFPPLKFIVKHTARRIVNQAANDTLVSGGRNYNLSLGGGNAVVCGIVTLCSCTFLMVVITYAWRAYHKPVPLAQTHLNDVGRKPVVREAEKRNVWTVTERNITKLDVDPRRPQHLEQAVNAIKNNVLIGEIRFKLGERTGRRVNRVLVADTNTILTNNHFVRELPCKLTLWLGPKTADGVQPSVVIDVDADMVVRDVERDLCVITTMAMPHRFKSIRHVFPKETFQSTGNVFYVRREEDGEIKVLNGHGLHRTQVSKMEGAEGVNMLCWASHPDVPTVYGDCGTVVLSQTPLGCVIVGLHVAYTPELRKAYALPITIADIPDTTFPTIGELAPHGVVAQVRTEFVSLLPKDKLYTDYHMDGHLMVHGQLKEFRARSKFSGKHTPHADQVLSVGEQFEPPITDRMAAPKADSWGQAQKVLENYLQPTHSMNETILRMCGEAMLDHFSEGLTPEDWEDIHPVPMDVAVNGYPGVPNVDSQKFTTSGGHGYRGPKLTHLSDPCSFAEWDAYRKYDHVVTAEVERIVDNARIGIRPHAVYTASMKDEMLSKAKVAAGKARVIYMCPVDFLTAMRMFTLGLTRVMVRRRDLFGIAVGLNSHSEEWDELVKLAEMLEGDNWIAGDFRCFESILGFLISNVGSKVFVGLCRRSGNFDERDLLAIETLLADTTNPTIDFFGTLITLMGGEASGHQLTTFFNCICNQLLHMYAYVVLCCKEEGKVAWYNCAREYFKKVVRNTLGDDVYQKICPSRPQYNHTTIMHLFATMGITYTMAEKDQASVPYIPLSEVSFLKRKFVDHEAFPGMKVAALDRNSIYKMLLYTIPSKSTTEEEQLASAFASAQAEAFFHGREFFEQIRALIDGLELSQEQRFRMREVSRPGWGQMIKRFVDASPKLQAEQLVPGQMTETAQTKDSDCHSYRIVLQTEWRMDPWGSTAMECSSEECIYTEVRPSFTKACKPKKRGNALCADNKLLATKTTKNPKNNGHHMEMTQEAVCKVITKLNNKVRSKAKKKDWEYRTVLQSQVVMDPAGIAPSGAVSTDVVAETTVFKNEPESWRVDLSSNTTSLAKSMSMSQDLKTYLSRPKLIHTYAWAENGANGVKSTFSPWSLFFADGNMAAKMRGFSLMRANLKLKFLINGSPFYYGSMLAAYDPMIGWRPDTATPAGYSLNCALVAVSQKPHIWLQNQDMATAEMTLPFLYPYPYIDVATAANLSSLGSVSLWQYVPLLSANGTSSTNIDIQVYAWAEDFELSGPTDRPILQSGFKHDGQISGPASAVAAAAGKLVNAPIIGAYAMATKMAAEGVGNIASLFGFTNVPNVADVAPMKQIPFQLASTEISEPVMKLSLQPKQEIAIGAVQHGGLPEDELALTRLLGRSSFIVGTSWDTTLTPGTPLFTTLVNPAMFQGGAGFTAHTPVSYISNWFQYWRGSLRYTFKVVRSPYHKGRVQISWDRMATNLNQGPTVGNPNTYTTIMDLDDDSECSFVVPYQQPSQFLNTFALPPNPTVLWSTASAPAGSFTNCNGVLSVRVVNRLTAPEATSSATILCFVSAEPDFQFAGPREYDTWATNACVSLSSLTNTIVQSSVVYDDSGEAHDYGSNPDTGDVYKEVFGEKVSSMREIMHRSSLSFNYNFSGTTESGILSQRIPLKRMPPPPGFYNNGWWDLTNSSGAGKTVFMSKFHPITAMTACFVGYKGTVNITANVDQVNGSPPSDTLSIYRIENGALLSPALRRPNQLNLFNPTQTFNNRHINGLINSYSGHGGMALTNTRTNAGLAAALPYYSNSGFQLSNMFTEYNNQDTITDANDDWWQLEWRYNKITGTTPEGFSNINVFYSTGPDFDLVWFQNIPLLFAATFTAPV